MIHPNALNVRRIPTGLYTQAAQDCLDSVLGQLSDGIWESKPSMAKYWEYAGIVRDDAGQVVIIVSTVKGTYLRHPNGFSGMNDFDVMRFFADKIKQIFKEECKDSPEKKLLWDRQCKHEVTYLSRMGEGHPEINVCDAYLAYEILKGRSRAQAKYPAEVISKVIGKPPTPEMIDAAKKIKELQAKCDAELNKTRADIKSKYEEQINELRKIIS